MNQHLIPNMHRAIEAMGDIMAHHDSMTPQTLAERLMDLRSILTNVQACLQAPLSDEDIVTLARPYASAYTNRHTPGLTSYGFMQDKLVAFVRVALHQAAVKGTV